jgi:hypothetical protein
MRALSGAVVSISLPRKASGKGTSLQPGVIWSKILTAKETTLPSCWLPGGLLCSCPLAIVWCASQHCTADQRSRQVADLAIAVSLVSGVGADTMPLLGLLVHCSASFKWEAGQCSASYHTG